MPASNEIIIRFIRNPHLSEQLAGDVVLTIKPLKKGFNISLEDPNLKQFENFTIMSSEKLDKYLRNTIKLASVDDDIKGGRIEKIQVSIPRYPDVMLTNDSSINVRFNKVSEALKVFHSS
jgi:hypothetical protein